MPPREWFVPDVDAAIGESSQDAEEARNEAELPVHRVGPLFAMDDRVRAGFPFVGRGIRSSRTLPGITDERTALLSATLLVPDPGVKSSGRRGRARKSAGKSGLGGGS